MKCPYNKLELLMALNNNDIESKLDTEEMAENLGDKVNNIIIEKFGRLPNSAKDLNIITAEINGITVEDLVRSPNMQFMIESMHDEIITLVISTLESNGFTNVEAWALFIMASNPNVLD